MSTTSYLFGGIASPRCQIALVLHLIALGILAGDSQSNLVVDRSLMHRASESLVARNERWTLVRHLR